jgi:CRP/FNR family cyclic AMP-dependent transcriptional regulator
MGLHRDMAGYPRRMSVDPAFLAKISLFAPLDDDERAVLAQAMVDRQVKPGEVLFRVGEPGDSMFIVVEGGIELSVKDKAGQKIVLHTPTAGEFFGELSLLDGGSRTATATAAEASSLYVLDREDILQLFKKRPEAGLDMLGAMGRMTRKATRCSRRGYRATSTRRRRASCRCSIGSPT